MPNWDDIVTLFSGSQFDLICDGTNLPCHKYETGQISTMNIPEGHSGPSVATVIFVLDQHFYFKFLMSHLFLAFSLSH